MKKLSILILIIFLASIAMLSNPAAATSQESEEFVIGLPSNPTTGYAWYPMFDARKVALIEQWYVQDTDCPPGFVGCGGITYFKFKEIKPGWTTINFNYKRYWEEEVISQRTFKVRM